MSETREFPLTEDLLETFMDSDPVDRREWRHGHRNAFVFEADGAHWLAWIDVHTEEGWQYGDTITATRVVQETRTVTYWVPAK